MIVSTHGIPRHKLVCIRKRDVLLNKKKFCKYDLSRSLYKNSNSRDLDSVNRVKLKALQVLVSKPRFRRSLKYEVKEAMHA